jgi:site-specific recombinase XerD
MSTVRSDNLPENVRERNGRYYFRCRVNGKQKELPLGTDLAVANRLAKQHAGRLAAIKSGLEHPDSSKWLEAQSQSIEVHVEAWRKSLRARGVSDKQAHQSRDRVLRLLDLAGVRRISTLELHAVEEALADLRRTGKGRSGNEGLSDRTVYHAARAVKGFSRWLRKTRRSQDDKLCDLTLPKVVLERTRRALSTAEVVTLINATGAEPRRADMSGPDRAILYAVATGTGFRLSEIESLAQESFDLISSPPTITCAAAYTKNGKTAVQPIHQDLAEMLAPWLARKGPSRPVFSMRRFQIARVLRKDLEAAGIENAALYDFHSLRHSYITAVVKSGCTVKVAQELARHADPKLTLNVYSHLTIHDLAEGLEGLSHVVAEVEAATLKTGTDVETVSHIKMDHSHTCTTSLVLESPAGSDADPVISGPRRPPMDPIDQAHRSIRPRRASRPSDASVRSDRSAQPTPRQSAWVGKSY